MAKLLTIGGPPVAAQTAGVLSKPRSCFMVCPYASVGEGFLSDTYHENQKIHLLISSPSADDLVARKLLSGRAGYSFFKSYIWSLGRKTEDVGISSVMRCRPRGGKFPIGADKKGTIQGCRFYDKEAIAQFNPDTYLITQALFETYGNPAFGRLLKNDIAKAFRLAENGLRPIVVMGLEAAGLVAPYIDGNGGCKAWRSHWQAMDDGWPHLRPQKVEEPAPAAFASATWQRKRR